VEVASTDSLTIVSFRHVVRKIKRGGSPSNDRELFPRRMKKRKSHCEMVLTQRKTKNGTQKQSKHNRVEPCTIRIGIQQNLIVYLQILRRKL
jgi:hypothetical protein